MRKRFWLFIGQNYYPSGAMRDFIKGFDTFDEASNFLAEGTWTEEDEGEHRYDKRNQWWELLDTQDCMVLRPWGEWQEVKEK